LRLRGRLLPPLLVLPRLRAGRRRRRADGAAQALLRAGRRFDARGEPATRAIAGGLATRGAHGLSATGARGDRRNGMMEVAIHD
jgi:hypothetical protein